MLCTIVTLSHTELSFQLAAKIYHSSHFLAVHQCMVMILHNLVLFSNQKTSTTPPDVNQSLPIHQVSVGESYPVGLWVPTWVAGRMTSALLLG